MNHMHLGWMTEDTLNQSIKNVIEKKKHTRINLVVSHILKGVC